MNHSKKTDFFFSASVVAIYKCTRLPGLADKEDFTCKHICDIVQSMD